MDGMDSMLVYLLHAIFTSFQIVLHAVFSATTDCLSLDDTNDNSDNDTL